MLTGQVFHCELEYFRVLVAAIRGGGFCLVPGFDLDDVALLAHFVTPEQPSEPPPNGRGPVEDNPRAEDAVEDVDDGVPYEGPCAVVVLLALVDEESLDGGVDEEDDRGNDADVGRYKILLSLLPSVAGIQCWGHWT